MQANNIRLTQEESDILYNLVVHELEHEEALRDSKDPAYDRRYRTRLLGLRKKLGDLA